MNNLANSFQQLPCDLEVERSYSSKPRRNQFLPTLFKVLENKENDDAISWDGDGSLVVLKDASLIASKVLSYYFGGMKFPSFIRQLNYYGFKRTSRRGSAKVYYHPQFQRGRKDLAEKIQRNHRSAYEPIKDERSAQSFKEIERDDESYMKARLAHLQAAVEELRRENISLRNWLGSLKEETLQPQSKQGREIPLEYAMGCPKNGQYQSFFKPQLHVRNFTTDTMAPKVQPSCNPEDDFVQIFQPRYKNSNSFVFDETGPELSTEEIINDNKGGKYDDIFNDVDTFVGNPFESGFPDMINSTEKNYQDFN